MGLRSVTIGGVKLLISVEGGLAKRIKTLLPKGADTLHPPAIPPPGVLSMLPGADPELVRRVNEIEWYHTIDLGSIVTRGAFDHRPLLSRYPLPERLDGKRVLDVATFDGFWALEFEKRGASEVVAIDVDNFGQIDLAAPVRARLPRERLEGRRTGNGFRLAAEVLGSKVKREICSVYDLSPARLGMFDFVYVSSLLLHLKCPMKALESILSVTRGEAMIVDYFDPRLPSGLIFAVEPNELCVWWAFSLGALQQMIRSAGFSRVDLLTKFAIGHLGQPADIWHAAFRAVP